MDIERLQKSDDDIVDIIYEGGKLLEYFKDLTQEDPKFRSYFSDFAMAGLQIFHLHEKLHQDFSELKNCKKEEYRK